MFNDVTIARLNGGLGRTLGSQDHITGLIFYNDILPSEWLPSINAWVTATPYVVGNKVYVASEKQYYVCITAHTSTTFASDVANWEVYTDTARKFDNLLDVEGAGITIDSTDWAVEYYHISEYFRINPNGEVWVYIAPIPTGNYDFNELSYLQYKTLGVLRQVGINANGLAYNTSELSKVQAICETLEIEHQPLQVAMAFDYSAITDLSTLTDLHTLDCNFVSVIIGQDFGGNGYAISPNNMACIGALMGAVSKAKVNESIAWVEKFPMSDGELDVIGFANGQASLSVSRSAQEDIHDKGYIFLIKHVGKANSYFNDNWTAVDILDDYSDISLNRTIQKAIRGIRTSLLPLLNSPLKVVKGGVMSAGTLSNFKTKTEQPLIAMVQDAEVSDYVVYIDPKQNVVATSTVNIVVKLLPYGTARWINVSLGFSTNV